MNKKQELIHSASSGQGIKNQGLNKVLMEIVEKKKKDLVEQKREIPLSKLKEFVSNLGKGRDLFKKNIIEAQNIALIAEIKLASPANPTLNSKVDIMDRASEYEKAEADAISYITENHFFKGDVAKIVEIAAVVKLPILQKDFVIDEYQIYEAKIVGSDALLLIARLVDSKTLKSFVKLCKVLGIEPVVEVNSLEDLKKALSTTAKIIAVNARDLSTFEVDVDRSCKLISKIPDKYLKLAFSGVKSAAEVKKYKKAGAKGVLVGTSLMTAKDIRGFIADLRKI